MRAKRWNGVLRIGGDAGSTDVFAKSIARTFTPVVSMARIAPAPIGPPQSCPAKTTSRTASFVERFADRRHVLRHHVIARMARLVREAEAEQVRRDHAGSARRSRCAARR